MGTSLATNWVLDRAFKHFRTPLSLWSDPWLTNPAHVNLGMSQAKLLLPVCISSCRKYVCLEHTHMHRHHLFCGELLGKEMAGVMCCIPDVMLLSAECRVLHWQIVLCSYHLETAFFITCTDHSSNSSAVVSSGIYIHFPSPISCTNLNPWQVPTIPDSTAVCGQAKSSRWEWHGASPGCEDGARQGTGVCPAMLLLRPKVWWSQLSSPGWTSDHLLAIYKMQGGNQGDSKCCSSHVPFTDPLLTPEEPASSRG